jgi:hypothetical protein
MLFELFVQNERGIEIELQVDENIRQDYTYGPGIFENECSGSLQNTALAHLLIQK